MGLSATRAESKLEAASLDAEWGSYPSDHDRCQVVSQHPKPGAEVEEYGQVRVNCKMRVPYVVGTKPRAAESRVERAGLTSRLVDEPWRYSVSRCEVVSQSREGWVGPNVTVRLGLKCNPPEPKPIQQAVTTPEPEPASDCDPNYSGCLDPNAYDYDCSGGSGDGPEYTGTVTVLGDDHYDLNADPDVGRANNDGSKDYGAERDRREPFACLVGLCVIGKRSRRRDQPGHPCDEDDNREDVAPTEILVVPLDPPIRAVAEDVAGARREPECMTDKREKCDNDHEDDREHDQGSNPTTIRVVAVPPRRHSPLLCFCWYTSNESRLGIQDRSVISQTSRLSRNR